jgi:hypothetical protein
MKHFQIILFFVLTLTSAYSQSTNNEIDDHIFASSLNELYPYDEDFPINKLDFVLSMQFNINYSMVTNDSHLKQKLINELLEQITTKGYKIPKKIKVKNYFEPYEFILDLPIYFNKQGHIIEIKKKPV